MGLDPNIDYTSLDAVNRLIENQNLYLIELKKADSIYKFLLAVGDWKNNSEQRKSNGLPILPPPTPPSGYTLPIEPPPPPPKPVDYTPVVEELNQWGQYPAPGDNNPAGTRINWAGLTLVKVVHRTPFGAAHWWERA